MLLVLVDAMIVLLSADLYRRRWLTWNQWLLLRVSLLLLHSMSFVRWFRQRQLRSTRLLPVVRLPLDLLRSQLGL